MVGNEFGRSNLVKYPTRIWVNPILEEINPFVHCDIPNGTTKSQLNRIRVRTLGKNRLHRRFEVKGEDSKWSYLSWSGRGAKESNSRAATRPPKAKSTSILLARSGGGCRQRIVSITSRL